MKTSEPYLNEFMIERGTLDPLGLWRVSDRMTSYLLAPFTTIVMSRPARFYVFFCWAIKQCTENNFQQTATLYWEKFFKLEAAFLCAIAMHEEEGHKYDFAGFIGGDSARQMLEKAGKNIILSRVHNGWDPNYTGSMQGLDLFEVVNSLPVLTPKGRQLAVAFEDCIKNTSYFINWRFKESVPLEVIKEYGQIACPCNLIEQGPQFEIERSIATEVLLQPLNGRTTISDQQAKTLQDSIQLILLAAHALNKKDLGFSRESWRQLASSGRYFEADKEASFEIPSSLQDTSNLWKMYELQSVFVYSMEAGLSSVLTWLHLEDEGRAILGRLADKTKPLLPEVLGICFGDTETSIGPDDSVSQIFGLITGRETNEDAATSYSLTKGIFDRILLTGLVNRDLANTADPAMTLCLSFSLFMHLVVSMFGEYREIDSSHLDFYRSLSSVDGNELSLPRIIESRYLPGSSAWGNSIWQEFWNFYVGNLIVDRQLDTRFRRGKEIAWFSKITELGLGTEIDLQMLQWENDYSPARYRAPREPVLMSLLENINLVEQTETGVWNLTKRGIEYCTGLINGN